MPITLEGIELPADVQWVNEFEGHGVGQIISPTLTGALLVEEVAQVQGRQIQLRSNDAVWVTRLVVEAIAALAATPLAEGETLTLVWGDGRSFDVVFDRSRGTGFSAIEATRLAADQHTSTHPYLIEIDLLTN